MRLSAQLLDRLTRWRELLERLEETSRKQAEWLQHAKNDGVIVWLWEQWDSLSECFERLREEADAVKADIERLMSESGRSWDTLAQKEAEEARHAAAVLHRINEWQNRSQMLLQTGFLRVLEQSVSFWLARSAKHRYAADGPDAPPLFIDEKG